jgi:uncharacterized membrane protein
MPIDVYLADWLNLLVRWAHVIAGIAWIGSSFYFIWLDARLNVPPRNPESPDVAGDLWAVHGGGFYHAQKYKVSPAQLPEPLHWFKWEAYSTWLTGFALLIIVYYLNAEALLVDPQIADISATTAVVASVALIVAAWLVYDGLCRFGPKGWTFAIVGLVLLLGTCFGVTQLFSGRGAFLQIGAMIGTIMAANVFFIIIPSQKELVAAKLRGEQPDASFGTRAKQRSVHNNYLTLPVVFTMISPHFPFTFADRTNWLVLFDIFVAGMLIRHFFNLRNQGRIAVALPVTAAVILLALGIAIAPRSLVPSSQPGEGASAANAVQFSQVRHIIAERCVACHSTTPTHPTSPVPAAGVTLDTEREIGAWAPRIFERVVVTKTMPFGNLTHMTDEERGVVGRWYAAGAATQ